MLDLLGFEADGVDFKAIFFGSVRQGLSGFAFRLEQMPSSDVVEEDFFSKEHVDEDSCVDKKPFLVEAVVAFRELLLLLGMSEKVMAGYRCN